MANEIVDISHSFSFYLLQNSLDTIRASINNGCLGEPLWAMLATAFSQFFITVNASINFFIYCFMCEPFRVGLKTQTIKLVKMCFPENIVR